MCMNNNWAVAGKFDSYLEGLHLLELELCVNYKTTQKPELRRLLPRKCVVPSTSPCCPKHPNNPANHHTSPSLGVLIFQYLKNVVIAKMIKLFDSSRLMMKFAVK
ncbi:unnamed protein product [Trifolium pratense]|uniref:Uncharacterized protein n=1 Tax=Trifolium pratense TaxID=57577 RepID=A0ACB0JXL8_TRIPR|nr:unnamed protein product [Trifolium pratense]